MPKRNITDIGKMNKRADIQIKSNVNDGRGGRDLTWTTLKTGWPCKVSTEAGDSMEKRQEHNESHIYKTFEGRIVKDIFNLKNTYRIAYQEISEKRAYEILRVVNVEDSNRYIKIWCNGNKWEAA